MKIFPGAFLAVAALLTLGQPAREPDRLIAIFVVDGLRPDSINPVDTPTIDRLRAEGVDYVNSHSVFPTSTRVNTATLVTGTYPARHGIVGNSMFVSGVHPQAPFDPGDYRQLMRLAEVDGRVNEAASGIPDSVGDRPSTSARSSCQVVLCRDVASRTKS